MGAVLLAKTAGLPLCLSCGHRQMLVLNSWDRFIIPKPFARIIFLHAEPIWVPESASDNDLEIYRKQLEESLNRAAKWCDEQFGTEKRGGG
jgi:lysophospholipid acyltransferase (LPLAT)-like uncharacterized protein